MVTARRLCAPTRIDRIARVAGGAFSIATTLEWIPSIRRWLGTAAKCDRIARIAAWWLGVAARIDLVACTSERWLGTATRIRDVALRALEVAAEVLASLDVAEMLFGVAVAAGFFEVAARWLGIATRIDLVAGTTEGRLGAAAR